jgi:orotate phosphoribosyltransferase
MSASNVFILILVIMVPSIFAMVAILLTLRLGQRTEKEQSRLLPISRRKPSAGYEKILEEFKRLPEKIEIDKDYECMKETLSSLAKQIRRMSSPFDFWSKKLLESVDILGNLQDRRERIRPMFKNPTLWLREHAERDITNQLNEIKSYAEEHDKENCSNSILQLHSVLDKWHHLTEDWLNLRNIASAGINPKDQKMEEIIKGKEWGWLSHGLEYFFQDPNTHEVFAWYYWGILSNPELLGKLTGCIVEELLQREVYLHFNAICAMSSTAAPLATMLTMLMNQKREQKSKKDPLVLLAIDNKTFKFLPDEPKPETEILMVDSGIQTGYHLNEATKAAQASGSTIAGAICFSFNDLLLKGKERLSIINDMINRKRLFYLFKMSELYQLWKDKRY